MENAPEAPAEAPKAPESEATPNTNPESQAPAAPDMHGFTSDELAEMRKFYDANGGFDKVKSRLSNPEPKQAEQPKAEDKDVPAQVEKAEPPRPQGAITQQEYFAKRFFLDLAELEQYSGIAKEIANGDVLKEMRTLGIPAFNQDGSINEDKVLGFLDLKSKTVPAKQTNTTPEASAAPTVDYVPVGEKIDNIDQAYAIIRQDASLKSRGMAGHPEVAKAEEFIKNSYKSGK